MGGKNAAPINELVYLRDKILKQPSYEDNKGNISLDDELGEGIDAGDSEDNNAMTLAKADFTIRTLEELQIRCQNTLKECRAKLVTEGRIRITSHVVSLVGTSSVLGSLGFGAERVAIATSVVTLIAGILIAVADFLGGAPGGQKIDVQSVYESLNGASMEAAIILSELNLLKQYGADMAVLQAKITEANSLARDINKNLGLMLSR